MSADVQPACVNTLRIAVMKPVDRSPGVEGVFATHVAPVAPSASVMSVNVPPTSIAIVPTGSMAVIVDDPDEACRRMWCSEETDRLIDQQSQELDRNRRFKATSGLQKKLEADAHAGGVARPVTRASGAISRRWRAGGKDTRATSSGSCVSDI